MFNRRLLSAALRPLLLLSAAIPASPQLAGKIRLMIGSTAASADGYFAYEAGAFKKCGVAVDVTQGAGGGSIANAIAANAADLGDVNAVTLANAHLHNIPLVAVAAGYTYDARDPFSAVAVAPAHRSGPRRILAGKVIGEPSLGGLGEVALNAWLDKNGADWRSVKYIEIPQADSVAALEQGRVDAVNIGDPWLVTESAHLRVLPKSYDAIANRFYVTLWLADSTWAEKNRETIRCFRSALNDGAQWAEAHPDLAQQVLDKWLKVTGTVPLRKYAHSGALETALLQPVLDAAAKYGTLKQAVAANSLILSDAR